MSESTTPTPEPITPERLDELVDTDPLQLRDAAATLLTQRDNARADATRVRVIVGNLQKLIEELRADWQRLHAELAQVTTAVTYLQGPEECLERECEEYFGDDGNERPGVEYCSHLKAKRLSVDEHLALVAERDEAVAELAEERARHGELVAEMQRTRTVAEDARAEAERLRKANADLDEGIGEVLRERDEREELLDQFAGLVAPVAVIGEHSSGNDPWANAMDLVTPAEEVERLRDERGRLAEQVTRARAKHRTPAERDDPDHPLCSCGLHSPCPTRRALDGTEGDQ